MRNTRLEGLTLEIILGIYILYYANFKLILGIILGIYILRHIYV